METLSGPIIQFKSYQLRSISKLNIICYTPHRTLLIGIHSHKIVSWRNRLTITISHQIINVNCQQNIDRLLIKLPDEQRKHFNKFTINFANTFHLSRRSLLCFFSLRAQIFRCKFSAFTQRLYLYFS